jgi:site-specific DNA-methyltransferase (adenine-specific)
MSFRIIQGDCEELLREDSLREIGFFRDIDLTFLDPPFNQAKYYASHNDSMPEEEYWGWMERIAEKIYQLTAPGGAIYFMQREKNTEYVLRCLRASGWILQNLILWKKMTSAIPSQIRYGKQYQIIAFATKGARPRVFNKLRIDPPLLANYKYERDRGIYVTDVWDDIRELTSGYFAGEEPLRDGNGERVHKQQSPVQLLLRIILSSSNPGDLVLDPFAGTGTTTVVSEQLDRDSIGIELDTKNAEAIRNRLSAQRIADNISQYYEDYRYTGNLGRIWPCGQPVQGRFF